MKKRLFALFRYAIFWLVFFIFDRLFFLVVQFHSSSQGTIIGLLGTFTNGIRLDISTTGYYLLLPFLFAIPSLYFSGSWYRIFLRWYSYLLIFFSSVIVVADANLYTYWGFRMDYTPLFYLKTPAEAMASVTTLKLILFICAVLIISGVFIWFYRKMVDGSFANHERVRRFVPGSLLFLILTGALIVPIRGGFGIAPINAGNVYFSNIMFLNHAAVNVVWNVGTTAFTHKPVSNPYITATNEEALAKFDSLVTSGGITRKVLNTDRPNILLILLESFSSYLVGPAGGDPLVTPNLNRYAGEGILFRQFYASGTRTDKALPAILSGYPAQPAQSIIKEPKKSQSLPSLVRILSELEYNSSFWYGGDINFANFKSYIISSGFETIVSQDDFNPDDFNSKWGVHDHILFKAFGDSMKAVREPFFNVILTLSSHEPFDVPMDPVFEGKDVMSDYKNSVYYTDKVVGEFLDWSRDQEWWKNTLVILVADHGARVGDMPAYSSDVFRIPMVWTGGAVSEKGLVIEKLGGQVDFPLTVLHQLGTDGAFPFGKDMLSDGSESFAFCTFNEGFIFLTDSSSVAYDHKPKMIVQQDGKNPGYAEAAGKAYLQVLFEDYLGR